jgi:ubiquinone/menaquinone biosynthesis C-methylase UbiE
MHFFERELVVVDDFEAEGLVLDIGGGGEGVIGRLKSDQVIAIDPNQRELEEAAEGPLKIIMDATNLQFLDESFTTVTSFYTLMYIKEQDALRQVFSEVNRVLTVGGRFLVWDVVLPARVEEHKDMAVFLLTVKLGEEELDTGYGMLWPEAGRRVSYYVDLAESAGLEVVRQNEEGRQLFLELRKP